MVIKNHVFWKVQQKSNFFTVHIYQQPIEPLQFDLILILQFILLSSTP